MLILYPATLLVISNRLLVESFKFSMCKTMISANSESFTSAFPFWMPFFPLAWLFFARTFDVTSSKGGDSGHPFLVPDFREIGFDISPLSLMSAEGFSIYDFYYVEVCSFFTHLIQSFYHKWMFNLVKGIFCIYWNDHMVLILHFVYVVYHIDWFVDVELFLHLWTNHDVWFF